MNTDDLLLQINEQSVLHMPSDDVIASLKSVSMAGLPIKLVVARAVEEAESGVEPDVPLEINDVRRTMCYYFGIKIRRLFIVKVWSY